jgi:hypothetical protein
MQKMINPSFTRGEYWLLETAVEVPIPICWLDWAEMEEALNKSGHGMSRSLLIETMRKLFKEGLITAHRFGKWNDAFELSPVEIETALNEKQNIKEHFYRLTKKGGIYWEAFARPNWNLYVSAGYEIPEENNIWTGEIACANKGHLEGYFRLLSHHDYDVDENTIQWDVFGPWDATYWKELPLGHRLRFRCHEKEKGQDHPTPPLSQCWYNNLWYQWR